MNPNLKWLWSCYKQPPTRLQLNSNYVRMHQSNPTAEQMVDWKEEFINNVPLSDEDKLYFRALTYEQLQKQWEIKKPDNHSFNHRKKK